MNVNKRIFDAVMQHSMLLYSLSSSDINELKEQFTEIVNTAILGLAFLLEDLSNREQVLLASGVYETKALQKIKTIYDDIEVDINHVLNEYVLASGLALVKNEVNFSREILKQLTLEKKLSINPQKAFDAALSKPMPMGSLVSEVLATVGAKAAEKVVTSVRAGLVSGSAIPEIVKQLKGTKELKYSDATTYPILRNLETVVRTARSHLANNAQLDVYKTLGAMQMIFVATLDSRTTIQCASLDGTVYDIDDAYPVPPLHYNCRSVIIPYFENVVTKRPAVGDEIELIDSRIKFKDWIATQSEEFQKKWLGTTRFELYKSGAYSIEHFMDQSGKVLTIEQLKEMDMRSFQ